MSKEILEFLQVMNPEEIENQLALQCAPFLAGLKISNLLSIRKENLHNVRSFLEKLGISYFIMLKTEKLVTILLYDRAGLELRLHEAGAIRLLKEAGYEKLTLGAVLRDFQLRYSSYMTNHRDFPHEMGIFLGYPLEDVEGFIKNEGNHFLCTGYWKVYHEPSKKMELFQKYDLAKETILRQVSCGISIAEIMNSYKKYELQSAAV